MAKLIVTYWRDIPSMVSGGSGRNKIKRELAPRFQEGIDRAAMRARKISADAYMSDWRTEQVEVEGDLEQLVVARVAEIEAQFPDDYLEKVIRAHGLVSKLQSTDDTEHTETTE